MFERVAVFLVLFLLFQYFETTKSERIKLTKEAPPPILLAEVECTTTTNLLKPLLIHVYSNWSPLGARRFLQLVKERYYDGGPLFRVVKGQIVQFGISLNPELEKEWGQKNIPDDPSLGFPFDRGFLSYGGSGKNSRASQIFIAYSAKGTQHIGHVPWETPFAKVVSGMDVADRFFDGDGKFSMDMNPWGEGPRQALIKREGKPYLDKNYPDISYINSCQVIAEYSDPLPEVWEQLKVPAAYEKLDKNKKNQNNNNNNNNNNKDGEKKEGEEVADLNGFLRALRGAHHERNY